MLTVGRDVSSFFPDVVKCIVTDNPELKSYVYTFILHYAHQKQELALLSINSIRKDCTDSNPRVRANALRAMSGIRVAMVHHLVMMSLKSAVKDSSSYVRRVCAHCLTRIDWYKIFFTLCLYQF